MSDNLTVEQLVNCAIEIWGSGTFEKSTQRSVHEAGLLQLEITKATSDLSWTPKWDATEAIGRTIQWYRRFEKDEPALELIKKDIETYLL